MGDMRTFIRMMTAASKVLEKNPPAAEQQELRKRVASLTGNCDDDATALDVSEATVELIHDRYWEPKLEPPESEAGQKWIEDRPCAHSRKFFLNMALQMFGDRPAQSISWFELANSAKQNYELEVRNAVRPYLEKWGLLPGKEEDL